MGLLWIAVVLCFIAVTRYVVYAVKGWWNQREYDRMHKDVETLQETVKNTPEGRFPGRTVAEYVHQASEVDRREAWRIARRLYTYPYAIDTPEQRRAAVQHILSDADIAHNPRAVAVAIHMIQQGKEHILASRVEEDSV